MMPFFGAVIADKKDEAKMKPGTVPWAHIKKRDNRSYCGEEVKENSEYMFNDAGHAVRNYKDSKTIRACPKCVAECEAAGVGTVKFMAPMATRGEENNK